MKIVEYQQRNEDGGFPAPNEAGFEHGEAVYIVEKAGMDSMLLLMQELWVAMSATMEMVDNTSSIIGQGSRPLIKRAREASKVAFDLGLKNRW